MFYCQKCKKEKEKEKKKRHLLPYYSNITYMSYTGDSNISNISIRLQNKTNGTWRDNSVLSTC